jgi:hypothetical protein
MPRRIVLCIIKNLTGTSPESKQDDNSEPISEKAALQSTKDPEHENTNTVSAERSFVAGRRSRRLSSKDAEQGWTPHKRLNFIVYIILMSGAFIVLDREYGGILTVWLRLHFPREAAALGFKVNRR